MVCGTGVEAPGWVFDKDIVGKISNIICKVVVFGHPLDI